MTNAKPTIAIVKPDHGANGGFERLIDQLSSGLTGRGYSVDLVTFDASTKPDNVYGYPVPEVFREWHDEYFQYVCLAEKTQELELSAYDLVVATQPPSHLVRHPRILGLFYHQARAFYDASDIFVEAGFATRDVHDAAVAAVADIDSTPAGNVRAWLAGSDVVAQRLQDYWNISPAKISPYRHPPICEVPANPPPQVALGDGPASVVCVNRLEFPKRSELVVAAVHELSATHGIAVHGHIVGDGSRLEYHQSVDAQLAALGPQALGDNSELWNHRGSIRPGWEIFDGPASGLVSFEGALSNTDRDKRYAEASVVVAPAWNEDYGLTVLEAFAWNRPVIVCSDGGGLAELVTHESNGLVVEPTSTAIAAAIKRLLDDPALAARLASAGRETLDYYSLENALDQFEVGIHAALQPDTQAATPPSHKAGNPVASPAALAHYMSDGRTRVEGWLGTEAMMMVHELSAQQRQDGLTGSVAEIGVHHGQLFILLALETVPGELAVGFDLFENQDQNVDKSGEGDRKVLERNLAANSVNSDRVRLVTANSMDLTAEDVTNYCGGQVRLFSVDGGHTAELTCNDLELAAAVLAPGGVVILDDYFNEMWPGVAEGAQQFLAQNPGKLIPFGVGSNKVCFTNSQAHVERYRKCITAAGTGHLMVNNELAGYEVTILTEL